MEYKTKYKVGDVVFYIDWEGVKVAKVNNIKVVDNSKIVKKIDKSDFLNRDIKIEYSLRSLEKLDPFYIPQIHVGFFHERWYNEKDLYSSEEELINLNS